LNKGSIKALYYGWIMKKWYYLRIKQLIISKSQLNKNIKWRKNIYLVDLIIKKLSKNKLERLLLKLEKIDVSKPALYKYKSLLNYLEAKIWLELVNDNKVKNINKNNTIKKNEVSTKNNSNINVFWGWIDSSTIKLWVWVSNIQSSDMNFNTSESQDISFTFSFDESIYTAPGKTLLVSKYDTFGFKITNLTTWKSQLLGSYFWAFPWTTHKISFFSDFFWNKNWKNNIKIEAISNNIYAYETYYNKTNITTFNINVKWIWTWASKKVWFWETSNDCETSFLGITYKLKSCWWINTKLVKWNWDKLVTFNIEESEKSWENIYLDMYWNSNYTYQVDWLPSWSITYNSPSYEKKWNNYKFKYVINENLLSIWTYNWILHIGIKKWDNTSIKNWLNLPIKVNVEPWVNESKIDFCKTKIWNTTLHIEPCNLNLKHNKWSWNKNFSFKVISSDWKSYWYDIRWNMENKNWWLDYIWVPKYSVQWWVINWFTWPHAQKNKMYFVDKYLEKWTYNTAIYIIPTDENWLKVRKLKLPIKLEVWDNIEPIIQKPILDNTNYCSWILDWVTYTLSPCSIDENKEINYKIIPSDLNKSYTYQIYWWGSWWIKWELNSTFYLDKTFTPYVYDGWYIKIQIESNWEFKEFRLWINFR